ncbi:hypothetical protein LDENG_00132640, partial [Lucifuga dentata]
YNRGTSLLLTESQLFYFLFCRDLQKHHHNTSLSVSPLIPKFSLSLYREMDTNPQGGKAYGLLKSHQEEKLNSVNEGFLSDPKYAEEEDLASKLEMFKSKYMEFDLNDQGEIDMMGLKRMLEKLGVAKTHLELKKMMSEVVGGTAKETINYTDFLKMMLGKRNAILKLILMFEGMSKVQEQTHAGPPRRKTFSDLP